MQPLLIASLIKMIHCPVLLLSSFPFVTSYDFLVPLASYYFATPIRDINVDDELTSEFS